MLWFFFALLWGGAIVLFLKILRSPGVEVTLCSLVIVFCFYKILFDSYARANFRYFIWKARTGKREWTRTVTLEDEYIAVLDGDYQSTYKYSQIKEITQFEGNIAFIMYGKQSFVLDADGFVGCTVEEFLAKVVVKKESGY